jgi:hypothetical protein
MMKKSLFKLVLLVLSTKTTPVSGRSYRDSQNLIGRVEFQWSNNLRKPLEDLLMKMFKRKIIE